MFLKPPSGSSALFDCFVSQKEAGEGGLPSLASRIFPRSELSNGFREFLALFTNFLPRGFWPRWDIHGMRLVLGGEGEEAKKLLYGFHTGDIICLSLLVPHLCLSRSMQIAPRPARCLVQLPGCWQSSSHVSRQTTLVNKLGRVLRKRLSTNCSFTNIKRCGTRGA